MAPRLAVGNIHQASCVRGVPLPPVGTEVRRAAIGGRGTSIYTRLTEQEILARCPVHGHPPWNTPAVRRVEGDPFA
jgi:hypothetical protein